MKNIYFLLLLIVISSLNLSCSDENDNTFEEKKITGLNSINYNSDGSIYSKNTYKYYYNNSNFINKIHIKRVYESKPERNHEYIINRVFIDNKVVVEEFDYIQKRTNSSNILKIDFSYTNDLITSETSTFDNDTERIINYFYNDKDYLESKQDIDESSKYSYFYNNQNLLEKEIYNENFESLFKYENVLNPFYKGSPLAHRKISFIQEEMRFFIDLEIQVEKNKTGYPLNIKKYRDGNLWSEVNYIYE
ncbi:hypothetical protein C8N26_2115 [Tenacibaculum lutimaris]|uniref:YD repeat-containing protein n=1 Tax=Tenacibaculum lutimaris TaxID=285258 RepID=A0A420DZ81_9FLAO|nr:hypothetical protein [Tenacibaculum lutimaris]RKF03125.1 hypothetical protein C8N26_2115 [Tenacibaculum lutimaris]